MVVRCPIRIMSQSESSRKYYVKNREKRKTASKEYYVKNKKMINEKKKVWYDKNATKSEFREHYQLIEKLARLRRKCLVMDKYGGKCSCCGENRSEFLSIDHINGNGNQHRKQIVGKIYPWLKRNKFPPGFQVLCHNCNMSKEWNSICPHKRDKDGKR